MIPARIERAMVVSRRRKRPVLGRPVPKRVGSARRRTARDRSSDDVWQLVEQMMEGGDAGAAAALVLDDVIEEGVRSSSKTRFLKVTRKGGQRFGKKFPAEVVPNHYAAVTPGSSVVLFGLEKKYPKGAASARLVGYIRRFRIGDTAEYDSYNLVYLGKIKKITDKQITIEHPYGDRRSVFDVATFDRKNYDLDVEAAVKRNQDWSD